VWGIEMNVQVVPVDVKNPHVMFMGLRGLPDIQGGVETHVQHLAAALHRKGCRVEVLSRTTYQDPRIQIWNGISVTRLWAPRSRSLETIVHSIICVLWAGLVRPDILHIHAIGPGIVAPLARFLGLVVVVTHHGPDYDRQKWGFLGRSVLRLGEFLSMRLASAVIVISPVIHDLVLKKHSRNSTIIPNGVIPPEVISSDAALKKYSLEAGKYILLVSRLVPEKRHLDLIAAFNAAKLMGWKLVLVGAADHPDEYSQAVREAARCNSAVVMTGSQFGVSLSELYAGAGLFVLPSSHEGLPIVMLEALSYGLPVLASDIPANLSVGLPQEHYFRVADVADLAGRIKDFVASGAGLGVQGAKAKLWVEDRYNWSVIADQTLAVYDGVRKSVRSADGFFK
jgi:glycosyltransferase involved in cell wall biosynthesis